MLRFVPAHGVAAFMVMAFVPLIGATMASEGAANDDPGGEMFLIGLACAVPAALIAMAAARVARSLHPDRPAGIAFLIMLVIFFAVAIAAEMKFGRGVKLIPALAFTFFTSVVSSMIAAALGGRDSKPA